MTSIAYAPYQYHVLFLAVFASLVALALGNPLTRRAMTVHETQVLPEGFSSRGAASPDTMLNLRLALAQTNPDGLVQSLMDVSTPGNALYGQHLTKEQVCRPALRRPHEKLTILACDTVVGRDLCGANAGDHGRRERVAQGE